jgi:Tol biopolymer transport system component
MIDERQVFERVMRGFVPPDDSLERLVRRRDRKRRNQRIGAVTLAIILALVSFAALTRAFRTAERPADQPTPKPQGIFSEVGGWIAYGNDQGIWAVNPTGATPADRIELSERPGEPLAWSSDGSKLLIFVPSGFSYDLLVLNADGTETRLTTPDFCCAPWWASLSPDGAQVVYSDSYGRYRTAIYAVDSAGGKPRLLRATIQSPGGSMLYAPAFSPDGTQIAYFDGGGDWGHNLWVMNADGSGARKLVDSEPISCRHIHRLVWSPDGSRLAFDCQEAGARHRLGRGHGIWVVNADGSGLTDVIPHGANPYWSPNGMRILYQRKNLGARRGPLEIARWDGTHVQTFGFGRSGPWNPLPLSVQQ